MLREPCFAQSAPPIAVLFAALLIALSGCYSEGNEQPYPPKTHALKMNEAARRDLEEGRFEAALAKATEAVEHDPAYAAAYATKAHALAGLGRIPEAIETLEIVTGAHPEFAEAQVSLGTLFEAQGDRIQARGRYREAVRAYDTRIASGPVTLDTRLDRAIAVYLAEGQVGGIRAINAIATEYPDFESALRIKKYIVADNRKFFLRWAEPHARAEAVDDTDPRANEKGSM